MAEIGCVWDHGTQNIAKHGTVDLTILGFGCSVGPADVEDMSDVGKLRELRFGIIRVGYIALNVLDWMVDVPVGSGPTSHPVYFPWAAGSVG